MSPLPDVGDRLPADVREILERATAFELIAVRPGPPRPEDEGRDRFRGEYPILGRAEVDRRTGRAVLDAVYRGIIGEPGADIRCFNPRHVVVGHAGDDAATLLICYECLKIDVFSSTGAGRWARTNRDVEPEVTRIFQQAGLEIAAKDE